MRKRSVLSAIRGILRQPIRARLLLIEAAALLVIARIVLRVVPFRWIATVLDRPFGDAEIQDSQAPSIREKVSWAVERAAWLPGDSSCFRLALAAHVMCRRRGVHTTLYYGATVDSLTGMKAHVWLKDGTAGIIGHALAENYQVLATFPDKACSR